MLAGILTATAASATVHNVTLNRAWATAGAFAGSNTAQYTGTGSWFKKVPPGPKAETYWAPASVLGVPFTIADIKRFTYHTVNPATTNLDFFVNLYTDSYAGGFGSFYGERLTGEPLYSNNYVAPTAGVWNTWDSDPGSNQLVFFDGNRCGNAGFNNAPTLATLKAAPFNWSTYGPNPTAGSAYASPIDYASMNVKYVSFQTGSGWAAFEGNIDAVRIELMNGDIINVDLEGSLNDTYVDDAWIGTAPGTPVLFPGDPNPHLFALDAFATVQGGVNAVDAGGTVHVAAGTYTEQVEIAKNLTVQGNGCGSTIVKGFASMPLSFSTGPNNFPIFYVHDASDVRIKNLTVDGDDKGNSNFRYIGVAYRNAGGKALDLCIVRIENSPFDGVQAGVGVHVSNNTGGPYALECGNLAISDFQKNAYVLSGNGLTVDVHDGSVKGKGYTAVTAQNGVQISGGAGGSVARVAISDIGYSPATFTASGVLVFGPVAPVQVSQLDGAAIITNVQAPISWYDANGSMNRIGVSGGADFGPIFIYNSSATPAASRGGASTSRNHPQVSPFDATAASGAGRATINSSYNVSVSNSCLDGTDVAGTVGVWAYSEGGPLAVTADHNEVTDWEEGFQAYGAATTLTANQNSISSNFTAGYENATGGPQDAQSNYWGAANGPSGDGPGSGDKVIGGNVDFTPFLPSGADANAGCGFTGVTHTITATAGSNGSIAPSGAVIVNDDDSQTFTITPNPGYAVLDVKVDNVSVGKPTSYTFTHVLADHTISATFVKLELSVNDVAKNELNSGLSNLNFTVTLSAHPTPPGTVTVDVHTVDGTAKVSDNDYVAVPVTTVSFGPADPLTKTVSVAIVGDTFYELNDQFTLELANATGGASILDASGTGTITNDDGKPLLLIDDVTSPEDETTQVFTVSLLSEAGVDVSVDYHTIDQSATAASGDYTAVALGTVVIPAHSTSATIPIAIHEDAIYEGDETYIVQLHNPTPNAIIVDTRGLGTIENDDAKPSLTAVDHAQAEGSSGPNAFLIPVTLSGQSQFTTRVAYSTANGSAIAPGDYTAKTDTLVIPPLATSGSISITVNGDITNEPDEHFFVNLIGVRDNVADIGDGQSDVTIQNDDNTTVPTVHVLAPNGGEVLLIGFPTKLAWSASDDQGVTNVDLKLSRDNGATYEDIALAQPNTGTYTWTVTGPPTGGPAPVFTALFQVVAHDAASNSGSDVSDSQFAILDLATATLVSLFQAEPLEGAVQVRWQFSADVDVAATTVQRSEADAGPWAQVIAEQQRVGDVMIAIDRSVVAGRSYFYRLASRISNGAEFTSSPIRVTAGESIASFGIAYVGPNPTTSTASIEYTIAKESVVDLSILDLQGRQVAKLVHGAFRPGRYQAVWSGEGERGRAPAGVYFVRYEGGGKHFVRRIVLAR